MLESSRQVFGVPGHVRALVERIKALHVLSLQLEIEDGRVLSNAIWADRFRNDDETVLQAPSNQNLSRRPLVLRCDLIDDRMLQSVPAGKGAVCLQLNPVAHAELEQLLLIQEGMELDLIDGGRNRRCRKQLLQVTNRVVAHADRPSESPVAELEQRLPRFVPEAGHRPVDEV